MLRSNHFQKIDLRQFSAFLNVTSIRNTHFFMSPETCAVLREATHSLLTKHMSQQRLRQDDMLGLMIMKPMIELDFDNEIITDLIYAKLKAACESDKVRQSSKYYLTSNFLFNVIVLQ
jgi:hypothetical protein